MKLLLAVAAFVALIAFADATKSRENVDLSYSFEAYLAEFSLSFPEHEHAQREVIFRQRLAKIVRHNKENHSWKMGVNHFTALFDEERRAMNGHKRIDSSLLAVKPHAHTMHISYPSKWDWREHTPNVLSAVKDQGQCGSCWAFASTEAMESAYALLTGQLPDASPQNILEAPNPDECGGTGGCSGGTASVAYSYLISEQQGGIASIYRYPYTSYWGQNFPPLNSSNPAKAPFAFISKYVELPINEEEPLLDAIANVGPITISVDASNWFEYSSGVYNNCSVNATIDHAVVAVGYTESYIIVRNSWSATWGEDGYIKLARTTACGTDNNPSDGVACKSSPSTLPVCGMCGCLSSSVYPVAAKGPVVME